MAVSVTVMAACSEPVEPDLQGPPAPSAYVVSPPPGKLPWPHHDPSWNSERYAEMLDELWVVNNFGLYQGSADGSFLYLHDGIDIVLPNGTPIHAIESGTVRSVQGTAPFYITVLIESDREPGHGWAYTHIYDIRVGAGDRVVQGTVLGVVSFSGLEHLHLDRVHLRPGGSWLSSQDRYKSQPDTFFVYTDTEPPVFDTRFRYVRNMTDEPFLPVAGDSIVAVSGDVDIVVGLRDPGEWARSKAPYGGPTPYGNRNAPSRLEYDIERWDGVVHRSVAFDMSKLLIQGLTRSRAWAREEALTLYQHYESVRPPAPPVGNHNAKFSYFVITNSDGIDPQELRPLDPLDAARAWRTAEQGPGGEPRFPNGTYVITVRAYDFKGNMAVQSGMVRVAN